MKKLILISMLAISTTANVFAFPDLRNLENIKDSNEAGQEFWVSKEHIELVKNRFVPKEGNSFDAYEGYDKNSKYKILISIEEGNEFCLIFELDGDDEYQDYLQILGSIYSFEFKEGRIIFIDHGDIGDCYFQSFDN